MKAVLASIAEFLIFAALWTLGAWVLIKRVRSRKKEDGDIQTLFGPK